MDKLALFDIDKTLLTSSCHNAAFSDAFEKVYGIKTTIDIIDHNGMTDKQIILDVLKINGLTEQEIRSKIEDCAKAMVESFNKSLNGSKIMPMEGARELLEELEKRNIMMGLVTGNLEPIAKAKMKKTGLSRYFKVGGFGSDDANRANLVKLAIKRAEENFGFNFDDNVFLIGDTPRDIAAGIGAKVKTIGVATGSYPAEQLKKSGADFVLESLKDTGRVIEIITG